MNDTPQNGDQQSQGRPLNCFMRFSDKFHRLFGMRGRLWSQIRELGTWVEFEAPEIGRKHSASYITVYFADGRVKEIRVDRKKLKIELPEFDALWQFLESMGLDGVSFDLRLERNQVEDVFVFLHARRKKIQCERPDSQASRLVRQLCSDGIHIACSEITIDNKILYVQYSYCTLAMSKVVHWFERARQDFRDHRALFYAAPKYAFLITVVATGGPLIYAISVKNGFMIAMTVFEALVMFVLVYLLFQVVGSVEYDNEEKAWNLSRAVNELEKYTNQINSDIRRARNVQENILPARGNMPFSDRIDWAFLYEPADQVGGDYFDVFSLDDGQIGMVFTDVSGHGMAAAMITAIIKTTLLSAARQQASIEGIAARLNENLCRFTPVESYAAVFVAFFDVRTGELNYANFGHQPEPWLFRRNENHIEQLCDARNLILGVQDVQNRELCFAQRHMDRGDRLIFISDGVIEAMNWDGHSWGQIKVEELIQNHQQKTLDELVSGIINSSREFSQGSPQKDDQTILALEII